MARQSNSGKTIISAGEIGAYTVCPEAWRLKNIDRVKIIHANSVEKGDALHKEWARNFSEAEQLSKWVRIIIYLIAVTILVFILMRR